MDRVETLNEDTCGFNAWHDTVMCLVLDCGLNVDVTDSMLVKVYERLPSSIKRIARQHTLTDTVFRDEAYAWLKHNLHVLTEIDNGI